MVVVVPLLLVLFGLAGLTVGGDMLVTWAVRLARRAGLPPHLVGITVVAAGTSLPELVVSLDASVRGMPDLAVGNVVGSNVYNVALILGLCAAIRPLAVSVATLRVDLPVMVFASVALALAGLDGQVSRPEALALLLGYVGYVAFQVRTAPRTTDEGELPVDATWPRIGGGVVLGLVVLAVSARLCVNGAVQLATLAGISERIIGLTLVAVGTSLPELFASLTATIRGHDDLAVGNLVGSNVFNILAIVGMSGTVLPLAVNGQLRTWDVPVMAAVAILLIPIAVSGHRVTRGEGAVLLGTSGAYTVSLLG